MRVGELLNSVGIINLLLLAVLIICCYTDLKERRILNIIIFPALLVALILQLATQGLAGAFSWGVGTLAGLALLFIPFLMRGIGAGDVKLLGVVGAFKGAGFVLESFLYAAIWGGLFSVLFLLKEKKLKKTLRNLGLSLKVLFFSCFRIFNLDSLENNEVAALPYGLAISLGTITCLVGDWL